MADTNALNQSAAAQLGLFTRRQASESGFDHRWLARHQRSGELRRITPVVFAFEAAPRSDLQGALAAVLHVGGRAAITARTGAAMWEVPGFKMPPFHVLLERRERWRYGPERVTIDGVPIVVHTSRTIPDSHIVRLHGVPIVSPTRLIFELSAMIHPGQLERALDRCWSRRLTSGPLLFRMFEELDVVGRRDLKTMRALLDARGIAYIPPASNLEARFQDLMTTARLGPFSRQVDLGSEVAWLARVDFGHDDKLAVVEVNGDAFHTALCDQEADRRRRQALERQGIVVIDVSEFEVWHDPQPALERVRRGLERAQPRARRAA